MRTYLRKLLSTVYFLPLIGLISCGGGSSNDTTVAQNRALQLSANGLTNSTCDGIATWDANKVYATPGMLVVQNGYEYKNNWWTQGNNPETNSGGAGSGQPWTLITNCGVAPTPIAEIIPAVTPPTTVTPTPSSSSNSTNSLPSPIQFTPLSTASGVINYHLNLPYGSGNIEKLSLSSNYTDLLISNYVAGALLGRMMREKYPNLQFSKDYIYGSLFGQLLQENIDTAGYINSTNWINANDAQRASLLAVGQGGPYQINDYSKRLEDSSGLGLVNFVALQKGLGYTVEQQDNGSQTLSKGPDSLDQKYFGPLAAAYFHFNDMNRLAMNNAQTWGPQSQYYAKCMSNLSLPSSAQAVNNIYDLILNAAYNAGTYSAIIKDYFRVCAGMYTTNPEMVQLKSLGDYSLSDAAYIVAIGSTESAGSTFILYPRQIRIYLDQIYNQKTFNSGAILATNSVQLHAQDISTIFTNVFGTMAYLNSTNQYGYIAPADSNKAFATALSTTGLSLTTVLNISTPAGRTQFFNLLDAAINNLATNLNISFSAVTQTTIGGASTSTSSSPTSSISNNCPSGSQVYPAGRGSYLSGTIVKASDGLLYKCNAGVAAWCNSSAEWAYAPATGSATSSAWTVQSCN